MGCSEKDHEPDSISSKAYEVTLEEVKAIAGQLSLSNEISSNKHLRAADYAIEKYYNDSINNFLYLINFGEKKRIYHYVK